MLSVIYIFLINLSFKVQSNKSAAIASFVVCSKIGLIEDTCPRFNMTSFKMKNLIPSQIYIAYRNVQQQGKYRQSHIGWS